MKLKRGNHKTNQQSSFIKNNNIMENKPVMLNAGGEVF